MAAFGACKAKAKVSLEASAALAGLVHMLLMDSKLEIEELRLASLAAVRRLRSGIDLQFIASSEVMSVAAGQGFMSLLLCCKDQMLQVCFAQQHPIQAHLLI